MNHDILRVLAQCLLFLLVLLLPILAVIMTDHFRRHPAPSEYAVLFSIVAAIGIVVFLPAITIVAGTALAALGIARLTGHLALSRLTYNHTFNPARVFPGDETNLEIRLDNRKLLPLAWLSVTDPIHHGLVLPGKDLDDHITFSDGVEVLDDLGHALVIHTAVGHFQGVRRTYRVTARRRGIYALGPATVASGDPFGIYRREVRLGGRIEMIVYPRVYQPDEIGLPFREALGELVARRALLDDPTLLAGSRDYVPGDQRRRMHWKATARTNRLQIRINDSSTTAQIMIVLNLNTYQHIWQGVDRDRMEATIDVAASLAIWGLSKDFAVGIHSNGGVPGLVKTARLAPSAHPRQSMILLEHLARVAYSGRFTAADVLIDESRRLRSGGSIVFVTPIMTPELIAILTSPHLSGRVSVVYCGRFAAPMVRGVSIHLAVPPLETIRAVS